MKKIFLAFFALLFMFVFLLPKTSNAENKFKDTFCPQNNLEKPEKAYFEYEYDENYGDVITMWYKPSIELRNLAVSYDLYQNDDLSFYDFYGIYDYYVAIEVDVKINDGSYLYDQTWDDPNFSGVDSIYDLAFRTYRSADATSLYNDFTLSDLCYIEDDETAFLDSALYKNGGVYHFDLENNTLTMRHRFVLRIEEASEEYEMIFSDWSDEVSIGKNATQEELSLPSKFSAPVIGDIKIDGEDESTNFTYSLTVPKDIYDAILYLSIKEDVYEPLSIESQVRINEGEWLYAYTANSSSIYDGLRTSSYDSSCKTTDKVEFRIRFIIYDGHEDYPTEWSNIIGINIENNKDNHK